jgi:hypothetical protein
LVIFCLPIVSHFPHPSPLVAFLFPKVFYSFLQRIFCGQKHVLYEKLMVVKYFFPFFEMALL